MKLYCKIEWFALHHFFFKWELTNFEPFIGYFNEDFLSDFKFPAHNVCACAGIEEACSFPALQTYFISEILLLFCIRKNISISCQKNHYYFISKIKLLFHVKNEPLPLVSASAGQPIPGNTDITERAWYRPAQVRSFTALSQQSRNAETFDRKTEK